MYNVELNLSAYEIVNGFITGYKAFIKGEQVATIEYRGGMWILGVIIGFKIVTFGFDTLEKAISELVEVVE